MVKTLLIDLIDTLISIPNRPRDLLYRRLGFSSPSSFEYTAHAVCLRSPKLSPKEFIDQFLNELGVNGNNSLRGRIHGDWRESLKKADYISGALETICALRESGYKLTIVSNTTPPTWEIIERLGLLKLVDSIVLSCDVGCLKPNRRIFEVALKSVGAKPSEACMIGDKLTTDIHGAVNLGIRAILVNARIDGPVFCEGNLDIVASIPSIKHVSPILDRLQNHCAVTHNGQSAFS